MHIRFHFPAIRRFVDWLRVLRHPVEISTVSLEHVIVSEEGEPDCLVAVLKIGDTRTDSDDPEHVDLAELERSFTEDGDFFIWTCSCGAPGCAGCFFGVRVQHNGDTVKWLDRDVPRRFIFDSGMLRSAFKNGIDEGNALLRDRPDLEITPDLNADYYQ